MNAVLKKKERIMKINLMSFKKNIKKNLQWKCMVFNNTYGLAIRKEIAEKYNIKTYSDLSAIASQLTFGAEYDFFEREDGFMMLYVKHIIINLKQQWIWILV